MRAGKKNEEYREKHRDGRQHQLARTTKTLESGTSGGRIGWGRGRGDVATLRSTKTGKKHLTLVETRRGRFSMFPRSYPLPPLASLSPFSLLSLRFHVFPLPLSLSLSFALPLIRRNFHRKFSLQAQSATPAAAVRGGSECSVVFISAP